MEEPADGKPLALCQNLGQLLQRQQSGGHRGRSIWPCESATDPLSGDRCCSPKPHPVNACAQVLWVSVTWAALQMISHIRRVFIAFVAEVNWHCSNLCRAACFTAAQQYASSGCSHGVSPANAKCRNTPAVVASRTTRSARCEAFASMLNKTCCVENIPPSALPINLNALENKSVPA